MVEEMNWEDKKATTEHLKKVKDLSAECIELYIAVQETEKRLKEQEKVLASREGLLQELMEDAGLEEYADYKIAIDAGYKAPVDDDGWRELKKFIEHKYGSETLNAMLRIHAGSVKAFVRKEHELARERGIDDFKMPGCPQPQPRSFIKRKK